MKRNFLILTVAAAVIFSGCTTIDLSDQQFDLAAQRQEQAAASSPAQEMEPPIPTELRLAYSAADSLNPYTMKTPLNRELVPLLYDSLTRLDKSWKPQNQLAQEVRLEGKLCTITLRKDAQFWDGTPLTGKDVIYSLTTAASSDTNWRAMLQNVASCALNSMGEVELKLYDADADFAALLSFPIIKEGTLGADYPIGVSRFYVSGTWTNGVILKPNPLYYGTSGALERILLTAVSDPDALSFHLKTNEIDLVYSDLSEPATANMSVSSVPVSLNNLVYIGINANRGLLANENFRRALSLAVNRNELVSKAYLSKARGTRYPFNPDFYRCGGLDLSAPQRLSEAETLLEGIGLTQKDDSGRRIRSGVPITLQLLVNSENAPRMAAASLIAEQFAQLGIKVDIVSQSFTQYQSSLALSNYDLYIGEAHLMDNMDFSILLGGGVLGYGTARNEDLRNAYQVYRSTGSGIEPLCEIFSSQSPFIPLVFREGMLSFNRAFRAEMVATEQDVFYNITEW